jgi:hypothetical protein
LNSSNHLVIRDAGISHANDFVERYEAVAIQISGGGSRLGTVFLASFVERASFIAYNITTGRTNGSADHCAQRAIMRRYCGSNRRAGSAANHSALLA